MSKWKCEICGNNFDNFHAHGFDNKIYCPLCYFKKLSADLQVENEKLKEQLEDMTDCRDIASGHRKEVQDRETRLLNQQQEFIKYLDDMLDGDNDIFSVVRVKEVLQKYKEIIGNDINVGSKGENKDE